MMDWRKFWHPYWGRVIVGSLGLFVLLPLLMGVIRRRFDDYATGIYLGTGIAVIWYTVETFYLRQAMVLANRIAVFPLVVARVQFVQVSGAAGQNYAERVVLKNIGKGVALAVQVQDFDVETTELGRMGKRIEGPDAIEAGQEVAVESYGFLEADNHVQKVVETLAPHLKPTAQAPHEVVISYADVAGGSHRSVMQMGRGGIRLLAQS